MLANVRAQELGPATVGDLELSEPFLRRVAARVVRSSFERDVRIVVADPAPATAPSSAALGEHAHEPGGASHAAGETNGASHAPAETGWLAWSIGAVLVLAIGAAVVTRARRKR